MPQHEEIGQANTDLRMMRVRVIPELERLLFMENVGGLEGIQSGNEGKGRGSGAAANHDGML